SDCTITCGDHSWPAHKSIICAQSKHFMGAFSSPYVEANATKYKVDNEASEVFEAMLRHFYSRSYDVPDSYRRSPVTYHTKVHNLALRYDVQGL
ncbi:hypothetical protein K431DRAFT_204401, partial [Polychaeton citri CBS 116435]